MYPQDECCRASAGKPRATSRYRRECRHTCLPAKPASHARPGANSACPRSDPDAPGKSGSDARLRRSTKSVTYPHRSIRKPTPPSLFAAPTRRHGDQVLPSPSFDVRPARESSSGPCGDCKLRHQDGFLPSPRHEPRSNQFQFRPAPDHPFVLRVASQTKDVTRADSCGRFRSATLH